MSRLELLADHLASARLKNFVGRETELRIFRQALAGAPGSPKLIVVHGPGGIGKTTLLQRFAAEAKAAKRPLVSIDAHDVRPSSTALEAAVAEVFTADAAVLLVDSVEKILDLDRWLREELLPRLPANALTVLASRFAPAPLWQADLGWSDILRVIPLEGLNTEESSALLASQGVNPTLRVALLHFAAGNPLALSLAAQTAAAQETPGDAPWTPPRNTVEQLLSHVVGEFPSSAHRRALEVCAHAAHTTEELLRVVLPDEDTAELFAWLRTLPFVRSGPQGLRPSRVVSDTLDDDLRWRDPNQYKAMHRTVRQHLVERIRHAPGEEALRAAGSYNYIVSDASWTRRHHGDRDEFSVCEAPLGRGDTDAVVEMTRATLGEASARAVAYWLGEQPSAFRVHRRHGLGDVEGFTAWLRIHALSAEARIADPLVDEAWETASAVAPLQPGEHLAVARFMIPSLNHHRFSQARNLWQNRVVFELLRAPFAWSCVVSDDPDFWKPLMTHLDMFEPSGTTMPRRRSHGLLFHDWRTVKIDEWLDRVDARLLSGSPGDSEEPQRYTSGLGRDETVAAVHAALRCWFDPDELAANPLVRSRLVHTHGGEPVAALREIITKAMERLENNPPTRPLHRVVATTFRSPSTQESTARKLNMAFSTYRRRLAKGVEDMGERVWRWETQGRIPE